MTRYILRLTLLFPLARECEDHLGRSLFPRRRQTLEASLDATILLTTYCPVPNVRKGLLPCLWVRADDEPWKTHSRHPAEWEGPGPWVAFLTIISSIGKALYFGTPDELYLGNDCEPCRRRFRSKISFPLPVVPVNHISGAIDLRRMRTVPSGPDLHATSRRQTSRKKSRM